MVGSGMIYFIPVLYVELVLKADLESYKNINMVGIPNAVALMVLAWVALYTWSNHALLEEIVASGVHEGAKVPVEPLDTEGTQQGASDGSEF